MSSVDADPVLVLVPVPEETIKHKKKVNERKK